MLNAFNNPYQKRNNHLEIRLKKVKIKLARWWIYFRYSGNPDYNPYLLTSRPKNIPFISLRTEEYGNMLTNHEHVKKKWADFWDEDNNFGYNYNKDQHIISSRSKKNPAYDVKQKENLRKKKLGSKNDFKIYCDSKQNPNKYQTLKKDKLVKSKRKRKFNEEKLSLVTNDVLNECGTLSSFENDLLGCDAFTTIRNELLPFGAHKKSSRKIVTPCYSEYEPSVKKEDVSQSVNKNHLISCAKNEEKSPILNIVDSESIHNIDLENEFNHESFYNNKKSNSYVRRAIRNKPNYNVLGFEGDRAAIHTKNENFGVRNWIVKSINSEAKNTLDNRLTLDSNPLEYHPEKCSIIQNPGFFDHNLSNIKTLDRHKIDNYKEVQIKNYVRPKKLKREKHKEKYTRPISRIIMDSTQDDVIAVFRKIKNNTKEKILDTFASIPQAQNKGSESKSIENFENLKNIDLLRTGIYKWKNFNNHNKNYNPNTLEVRKCKENISSNDASLENEVLETKIGTERTHHKINKIVTFISPKENELYDDNKENCEPEIDLFYDEFGIIADYENNETI